VKQTDRKRDSQINGQTGRRTYILIANTALQYAARPKNGYRATVCITANILILLALCIVTSTHREKEGERERERERDLHTIVLKEGRPSAKYL